MHLLPTPPSLSTAIRDIPLQRFRRRASRRRGPSWKPRSVRGRGSCPRSRPAAAPPEAFCCTEQRGIPVHHTDITPLPSSGSHNRILTSSARPSCSKSPESRSPPSGMQNSFSDREIYPTSTNSSDPKRNSVNPPPHLSYRSFSLIPSLSRNAMEKCIVFCDSTRYGKRLLQCSSSSAG